MSVVPANEELERDNKNLVDPSITAASKTTVAIRHP